jgi:hypothetical protein
MKIYSSLILALLLFVACADKKNQKTTEEVSQPTEEKMMNEGYSKARIVHDEEAEAPCDYLLLSGDQMMEPMELSKDFKQADLKVWLKYVPQRRQGRCEGALPIDITEIKKRAKN